MSEEPECVFCKAEVGKLGIIEKYAGSCDACGTGTWPEAIIVRCIGHGLGIHSFVPEGIVYCDGCGSILTQISIYCSTKSIDVTEEFSRLKR